ncbi:inosine/xanthosine triphosphatase [Methanocaldococcus sp.]
MKNIVVALGSTNPVKVKATEEAFNKVFGIVKVVSVNVDSKVSPHPIGLEETYRGALNRAKEAYKIIKCDYSVGIEAGMIKVEDHYLDVHIAVVYDGSKETVGLSQGFEYPKYVVKEILKGKEGKEIAEEISGIKDIGKTVGFIGYLTDNNILRKDLCRESVIMALIPRLKKNERLYNENR